MSGVNKAILLGRLGKDPKITKSAESGKHLAQFSIATSETYKDKDGNKQEATEWHNVVFFGLIVEAVIEKFVRKGSLVYVEGKLATRKYVGADNIERYATSVVGSNITLCGVNSNNTQPDAEAFTEPSSGEPMGDVDDLPF